MIARGKDNLPGEEDQQRANTKTPSWRGSYTAASVRVYFFCSLLVSSISMIDDKSWLAQPASCSLTVGSVLWLAPRSRRIARTRSSKGWGSERLPAACSLENSRQECYQRRAGLPRNWPHISSFVWVESKGAVAHRLETLSVKSSLVLSVKRKACSKKETGADGRRQSCDRNPPS